MQFPNKNGVAVGTAFCLSVRLKTSYLLNANPKRLQQQREFSSLQQRGVQSLRAADTATAAFAIAETIVNMTSYFAATLYFYLCSSSVSNRMKLANLFRIQISLNTSKLSPKNP